MQDVYAWREGLLIGMSCVRIRPHVLDRWMATQPAQAQFVRLEIHTRRIFVNTVGYLSTSYVIRQFEESPSPSKMSAIQVESTPACKFFAIDYSAFRQALSCQRRARADVLLPGMCFHAAHREHYHETVSGLDRASGAWPTIGHTPARARLTSSVTKSTERQPDQQD